MTKPSDTHLVAHRLREARKRLFRSAAAAAEGLGMNPSTVRAHENGQNGVNIFDLERYARRYGVSTDWLLAGRGDMEIAETPPNLVLMDHYPITAILMDGRWIENDDRTMDWAGEEWVTTPGGNLEEIEYSDPRYPSDILVAAKVRIVDPLPAEGPYLDGSVVLAVPTTFIGVRDGDHVVVIREKQPVGDFAQINWTLKKVRHEKDGTWFDSLLSQDPPLRWEGDYIETGEAHHILAVVVGCVTRRPVPALDLRERIEHEAQLKAQRDSAKRFSLRSMSKVSSKKF